MNASPAYVCCQVLSSTHLEQIRSWWGQLAIQVTAPRISLSERELPLKTGEIYQLLLSTDLQALLLASPQGRLFPRITLLPLPGLTSTLQQWLQHTKNARND